MLRPAELKESGLRWSSHAAFLGQSASLWPGKSGSSSCRIVPSLEAGAALLSGPTAGGVEFSEVAGWHVSSSLNGALNYPGLGLSSH